MRRPVRFTRGVVDQDIVVNTVGTVAASTLPGRGKLKAIGGTQFMSVQEALGQIAYTIIWKDLSPSATQQIKTRQSPLFFHLL